jgi:hypothetical protein
MAKSSSTSDTSGSSVKILSFDVGIKNLAYCLMEKKDNNVKILKWEIINLVEDRNLCQFVLKNKRVCGKIGRFTCSHVCPQATSPENNNNMKEVVVCNSHKNNYTPIEVENNNFNCNHNKCRNKSSINLMNKQEWSWCETHKKDIKSVLRNFKPKKLTFQNCSQQPIQELAKKLFNKLDADKDFILVDEVLIENQPSLKNPNMKTISTLLYSYFVMRGITDKYRTLSNITNIKFISPSNKLKIDKSTTNKKLKDAKEKDQKEVYEITKGLGKIYCRALITDDEKKLLEKYDKQDDLCDCFLQGFQYLFNPVPQNYIDKLKAINQDDLTVKKIKSKKENKVKENK